MRRWDEKGAALITVLLLVAVMSVLAVALLDDIRFGIRRGMNAAENGQAQWYALGAEALARSRIARLSSGSGHTSLAGNWPGRFVQFPVEEGQVGMRLADGGACFNLNSVVEGAGEMLRRRDRGAAQFMALLVALEFPPQDAATLAASLVDWMDSDSLRESGGAEDEAYATSPAGHRTGATLLAEVSELRAIHGFTDGVYRRLRPYICALPSTDMTMINVNTLPPTSAVLLTALTDGRATQHSGQSRFWLRSAKVAVPANRFRFVPGSSGWRRMYSMATRRRFPPRCSRAVGRETYGLCPGVGGPRNEKRTHRHLSCRPAQGAGLHDHRGQEHWPRLAQTASG